MKTKAKVPFYSQQKHMFSSALSVPLSASVSALNSQLWPLDFQLSTFDLFNHNGASGSMNFIERGG